MITLTILILLAVGLAIGTVIALVIGGASFLIVFADVLICAAIIVLIVKYLFK